MSNKLCGRIEECGRRAQSSVDALNHRQPPSVPAEVLERSFRDVIAPHMS